MTRKTLLTVAAAATIAVVAAASFAAGGHDGSGPRHMMRGDHAQGTQDHRGPGMTRHGAGGPMGMTDSPVFQAFDADGDGTVSNAEAEAGLAGLLATHDSDGDGSLSRVEFNALFAELTRHRADRPFAMLDVDENDRIDAEEMQFPAQMMARMRFMRANDAPVATE